MRNNVLMKILSSLPIILITLYFIPFLGICLILLRLFIKNSKKKIFTPICIFGAGFLILVPKMMHWVLDIINFDSSKIPYLNDIIDSKLYNVEFLNYSKRLICIGIVFLIISYVLQLIFDKISGGFFNYINDMQKRDAEISKQNDMQIKIKQEKAKNTSYAKCPNCGSDNLIGEKFTTCKFCRSKIENKNFKV